MNRLSVCIFALVVGMTALHWTTIAQAQESVPVVADAKAEWQTLNERVIKAYHSGDYDAGLTAALAALDIANTAFGKDHPDTLSSVNNLGMLYESQGLYAQAEPLLLLALATRERVLGKDHPDTLNSVNNLGALYLSQGLYAQAGPLLLHALETNERVLGKDHPDTLSSVNNLGMLYEGQGLYAQAEPLLLLALATRERVLGKDHPDTLLSLNNLGVLYLSQGLYAQAEPLYLRALEGNERVLGKDHPDTLQSVNNLGALYQSQGLYAQAEPLFLRALETRERVPGKDHPDTLLSVNNLGALYSTQGLYAQAEPLYLRALETRERVLGKDHPDTLTSVNNLGYLYLAQGLYAQAEPLYLRALEARERILGKDHPSTLHSVNNLGSLYSTQGLYAQAEPLYLRALEGTERILGKDHPDTLSSVNNLGYLYLAQGLYAQAEPLFLRALEARERVLGKDHPDTLLSVNNLGFLYQTQGLYAQAELLFLRAIMDAERVLGEDHISLVAYRGNYANLLAEHLEAGPAAIYYLKRAVNILQVVRANLSELQDTTQAAFLEKNKSYYTQLQEWLIEAGRFAEAEQVGRMLKEQEYFEFIRRRAGDGPDPRQSRTELTRREAEWDAQLNNWAERPNLVAVQVSTLKNRQRASGLTQLELTQLEDLEAEYDDAYAAYKTKVNAWLEDVRALSDNVIQEEAQAIEAKFHDDLQQEIQSFGEDVAVLQIVAFEDGLHFFLITAHAFKHIETTTRRSDLYTAIFDTRDALSLFETGRAGGPVSSLAAERTDTLTPSLHILYDMLLAPVRQELEDAGTQTVMLNLQGPIRYAPFAALHDGDEYLTQRFKLALYTPAARTKFVTTDALTKATGFGVSKGYEGFSPLPAVARELERLMPGADGIGVLDGDMYLDEAFTRISLESALEAHNPILHIASHFSMRPGNDADSFLLLGNGERLTLADINRSSKLRFRGVEILTLSACSTALGTEGTGAEVEGFGVLAQAKGAESVVATLWNVADDATATFMETFYKRIALGTGTKAEALQAAQLALLNDPDTAHPYYWAPYILMGNWR